MLPRDRVPTPNREKTPLNGESAHLSRRHAPIARRERSPRPLAGVIRRCLGPSTAVTVLMVL